MKSVKLAMLVAGASFAAMAFIGSPIASAEHPWIALCKANELLLCKESNLVKHPLLGRLSLSAASWEFQTPKFPIKCSLGTGQSEEIESQQKSKFSTTLESLTFTGCTPCGLTATTSQPVTLAMETDAGNDWKLNTSSLKLKFTNCLGTGLNCTFEGNLSSKVQMNETESFVQVEGAEFKLIEGLSSLCGKTIKWTSAKTAFKWRLDTPGGATDGIWPSLLEHLTEKSTANHSWIALCKVSELLLCAQGNLVKHPLLGRFLLEIGAGEFKAAFPIKCSSGLGRSLELESQQENEFNTTLKSLSLEGCSGCGSAFAFLQPASLTMGTYEGNDWKFKINGLRFQFNDCIEPGVACEFEGNLDLKVQMSETESFVEPEGAEFKLIKGNESTCGKTGKWVSGRATFRWIIESGENAGTYNVWPSLLEALTKA
jgi:hypothetical protein